MAIFFSGHDGWEQLSAERTDFQPAEQSVASEYFVMEVTNAYWEKQVFRHATSDPSDAEIVEQETLVLEVSFSNQVAQRLDLICYMIDDKGFSYSYETDMSTTFEKSLFMPWLAPHETLQGVMIFAPINDGRSLWLRCGLCDNRYTCVEGKLHSIELQVR